MHERVKDPTKVSQVVLSNRKVFDVMNDAPGHSSFTVNDDGTYSFDFYGKGLQRITVRASAVDAIVESVK
jgi:hypothetical protein